MNELQKSVLHWLAAVEDLRDSEEERPDYLRSYFRERGRQTAGAESVISPVESRLSPLEW